MTGWKELRDYHNKQDFKSQVAVYMEIAKGNLDYVKKTAILNFALGAFYKSEESIDSDQYRSLKSEIAKIEESFIRRHLKKDPKANRFPYLSVNHIHKNFLAEIRYEAKVKLENKVAVEQIYIDIAAETKNFVATLVKECQSVLGIEPCSFAVIAFGSLARNEATPYSDLEFGILIDIDTEQNKGYFRKLTKYINIKVLNLTETSPKIESLKLPGMLKEKDDKSAKEQSEFFDYTKNPVKKGFAFDSKANACKTPLGNMHLDIESDKKFELIQTPSKMADYHSEEWFARNKNLSSTIATAALICGNKTLLQKYNLYTSIRLNTQREKRGKELLEKDVIKFEPKVGKVSFYGSTFSREYQVKYDIYRLPNLILDDIALMKGLSSKSGWGRIRELREKRFFSDRTTEEFLSLFSEVTAIRLQKYFDNGIQEDKLIADKKLEDNEDLFKIYKKLILLADFAVTLVHYGKNIFNYHFDNLLDIRVHLKLEQYDKAIDVCKKYLIDDSTADTKIAAYDHTGMYYSTDNSDQEDRADSKMSVREQTNEAMPVEEKQRENNNKKLVDSDKALVLYMYGQALIGKRQYEEALVKLNSAGVLAPKSGLIMCAHAQVLIYLGKIEEAKKILEEAKKIKPDTTRLDYIPHPAEINNEHLKYSIDYTMGKVLLHSGDITGGIMYLKEASSTKSKFQSVEAKSILLDAYIENCQYDEAKKHAEELLKTVKDVFGNGTLHYALILQLKAKMLSHIGLYKESLENFYNALTLYNGNELIDARSKSSCLIGIAMCYSLQLKAGTLENISIDELSSITLSCSSAYTDNHQDLSLKLEACTLENISIDELLSAILSRFSSDTVNHPDLLRVVFNQATIFSNIADYYFRLDKKDKAKEYCKLGVKISEKLENTQCPHDNTIEIQALNLHSSILSTLFSITKKENDSNKSLELAEESVRKASILLRYRESQRNSKILSICYNSLGSAYLMKKMNLEAIYCFKKAEEVLKPKLDEVIMQKKPEIKLKLAVWKSYDPSVVTIYSNLAQAYFRRPNGISDIRIALYYSARALEILLKITSPDKKNTNLSDCYKLIANLLELRLQGSKAAFYLKKSNDIVYKLNLGNPGNITALRKKNIKITWLSKELAYLDEVHNGQSIKDIFLKESTKTQYKYLAELLNKQETEEPKYNKRFEHFKKEIHNNMYPEELDFMTALQERYGINLVDTPIDGNCFFHAVEMQLRLLNNGETIMSYQQIRISASNYISNHKNEFRDFMINETIDQYIDRMSQDGQWADNTIIQALSMELGINIVIISNTHPDLPQVIGSIKFQQSIYLGHIVERHYVSLNNVGELHPGFLELKDKVHQSLLRQVQEIQGENFEAQTSSILEKSDSNTSSDNKSITLCIHSIDYTNPNLILRQNEMLHQAGQIAGMYGINRLINLGEDPEVAIGIILSAKKYGLSAVLNTLICDIRINTISNVAVVNSGALDANFNMDSRSVNLNNSQSWVDRYYAIENNRSTHSIGL